MDIIAVINQKGGAGKSTTSQALYHGFGLLGYKALFIDLDPQGNTSFTLKADKNGDYPTIYEVLKQKCDINEAIQKTNNADVIASSPYLSGADAEILEVGKEFRLRDALRKLNENYEFIVMDTPPALGILTVNALTASNSVVVPAEADSYNMQGISQLFDTISLVKQYTNPNLIVKGVLLNRYSPRQLYDRSILATLNETLLSFDTKLFNTIIRRAVNIKEAQGEQRSIYDYAPNATATEDYKRFIYEYLGRLSEIEETEEKHHG